MSGVLDSRVHNMGLRTFRTNDTPYGNAKDIMLDEMYRQDKEDSIRPDFLGGRPIDQRIGVADTFVVFDSIERDYNESDTSKGLFVFNIRSEGITGDGYIGAKGDLHDIIQIEAMSFIFPKLPCYIYNLNDESKTCKGGINSSLPILKPNVCLPLVCPLPTKENFYNLKLINEDIDLCSTNNDCDICPSYLSQLEKTRINIQIKEVSEQSISDTGGKKHSLEFDLINYGRTDIQLNSIYASPINFGYIFTDPITRLDTISMVIRNSAGVPLAFDPDMFPCTPMDCLEFVYSDKQPILPIPITPTYSSDTILPGTIGLPLPPGKALPAIPAYYSQFAELVTETWNAYRTLGVITPNVQLLLRKFKPKQADPKLYKYLTNNILLGGANGYNADRSFRLNPDIVMTEFISAYSKSYNLVSGGSNVITMSRTSKQIPLNYNTQILLREWREINQTWLLPDIPLPVGNLPIHCFTEGRSFKIGTTTISSVTQVVSWGGRTFHIKDLKDIYYDRVVLTETDSSMPPSVVLPNAVNEGVYERLRNTIVAISLPISQQKRIRLNPNQYIVEPNIRTDFYDVVEGKSFTFDGQYVNNLYTPPTIPSYNPTSLMPVKVTVNTTNQSVRLFHQGVVESSGVSPYTDLTPVRENRVYHINEMKDIYADKIVVTAGFPGLSCLDVIVSCNRIRIPARFRKIVRRITNLLAP